MLLPHQFSRRILLLVSGMSPQIVTETLYALTQTMTPAFVPTEVHLISTRTGAEQARLNLLSGSKHFIQFCQDYDIDPNIFSADRISVICDANNQVLADIRTPAENEATADFITRKIQELTGYSEAALHVSMAGGRKTMGYYAGYALSLFGRPQDRLSHVLVQEGYEGLRDFYYPTPKEHTIHDREGKALDAAKAEVSLAEIPFVRLRDGLLSHIAEGRLNFNEAIALSQQAETEPSLLIDISNRTLVCQGMKVTLQPLDFAFYVWMAKRGKPVTARDIPKTVEGHEAVRHEGYAQELLATYRDIEGEMRDTDRVEEGLRDGMTRSYFESKKSQIKKALVRMLGERLATPYLIHTTGSRGESLFTLGLENHQIEWKRK